MFRCHKMQNGLLISSSSVWLENYNTIFSLKLYSVKRAVSVS